MAILKLELTENETFEFKCTGLEADIVVMIHQACRLEPKLAITILAGLGLHFKDIGVQPAEVYNMLKTGYKTID